METWDFWEVNRLVSMGFKQYTYCLNFTMAHVHFSGHWSSIWLIAIFGFKIFWIYKSLLITYSIMWIKPISSLAFKFNVFIIKKIISSVFLFLRVITLIDINTFLIWDSFFLKSKFFVFVISSSLQQINVNIYCGCYLIEINLLCSNTRSSVRIPLT